MRSAGAQQVGFICTDTDRQGKGVTAAKRWVMTGRAGRVSVASEALAEKELESKLRDRLFDLGEVAAGGRVAAQTMFADQGPEREVGFRAVLRGIAGAQGSESGS
jgi:hypothetical protein